MKATKSFQMNRRVPAFFLINIIKEVLSADFNKKWQVYVDEVKKEVSILCYRDVADKQQRIEGVEIKVLEKVDPLDHQAMLTHFTAELSAAMIPSILEKGHIQSDFEKFANQLNARIESLPRHLMAYYGQEPAIIQVSPE